MYVTYMYEYIYCYALQYACSMIIDINMCCVQCVCYMIIMCTVCTVHIMLYNAYAMWLYVICMYVHIMLYDAYAIWL